MILFNLFYITATKRLIISMSVLFKRFRYCHRMRSVRSKVKVSHSLVLGGLNISTWYNCILLFNNKAFLDGSLYIFHDFLLWENPHQAQNSNIASSHSTQFTDLLILAVDNCTAIVLSIAILLSGLRVASGAPSGEVKWWKNPCSKHNVRHSRSTAENELNRSLEHMNATFLKDIRDMYKVGFGNRRNLVSFWHRPFSYRRVNLYVSF